MEMRILAFTSRDQALLGLFNSAHSAENDVYRLMASLCFGVPVERVSKEERDRAKTISLGIVYGMGPANLAEKLSSKDKSITEGQAKTLIQQWYSKVSSEFRAVAQ